MDVVVLVEELASSTIGSTFNQYRDGVRAKLLRERLGEYIERHTAAPLLLVGEAPGYRGARISGIPFTSERQVSGSGPTEATATVVHRVLHELGLTNDVLLWNVVPTHPGTAFSNRVPVAAEIEAGVRFVRRLAVGRKVIAVGRVAQQALDVPSIRHPARGGAAEFRSGLLRAAGGVGSTGPRDPSPAARREHAPTCRDPRDPFPRGCAVSS